MRVHDSVADVRAVSVRRDAGLWGYERALWRHGLGPVAGVDEAGRGACAGPLVVAAAILPRTRPASLDRLADSKQLSAATREYLYKRIVDVAIAWHTVVVPPGDVDRTGLHVMNIQAMRRAIAALATPPGYVLVDGFGVPGLTAPSLAVLKGDQVAACVAAASVLAKVTRDRIMHSLHERHPEYDFPRHKGYVTAAHAAALDRYGPCDEHRLSYVNVAGALRSRSSRLEDTVAETDVDSGAHV